MLIICIYTIAVVKSKSVSVYEFTQTLKLSLERNVLVFWTKYISMYLPVIVQTLWQMIYQSIHSYPAW